MIAGIGVDILNVMRLEKSLSFDDPFVVKTFTKAEILEAKQRRDPEKYFASRFACKEAVFKSLRMNGNLVRLNEIEIRGSEIGYLSVFLLGSLKKYADERGIVSVQVSLSYEDHYVIAYAIAQMN